jgi:hypothetical protein
MRLRSIGKNALHLMMFSHIAHTPVLQPVRLSYLPAASMYVLALSGAVFSLSS